MLESVAGVILKTVFNGICLSVNGRSTELKDTIDAVCSMEATRDESLGWMSRCVSRAIMTGFNSIDFMNDVSSLVPIKQAGLDSSYKMTKETSQFTQFANSEARHILDLLNSWKQDMSNLVSFQEDEILLQMTNVAFNVWRQKIEKTIWDKIKSGHTLYREFRCVYGRVTSAFDIQVYVDRIRELAMFSAHSSQLSDDYMQTDELKSIAVELVSKSRNGSITAADLVGSYTAKIEDAAAKI